MKYELRSISATSILLSSIPAVLFLLGLLGGVLTFVIIPNPQIEPMNTLTRLMATGLFGLLYMVLMVALLMVVSFLYNLFTQTIGLRGIRVEIEEMEE
ncbi:MAG: DUF3566 domain-containing protein [Elusimicrobia bacterium]|nr:DUF3566 domain-containing protein [Elusimicrobiota bacterium]